MGTVGVTKDRNDHPAWGARGAVHHATPDAVGLCGKPVVLVPRLDSMADLVVTCSGCLRLAR